MPEPRLTSPQISPSVTSPFWRRNLRLVAPLVAAWAALTFVPAYFARDLVFDFGGWPFAFWMAAYGAPLAYLVIIVIYAWTMGRAGASGADEERDT